MKTLPAALWAAALLLPAALALGEVISTQTIPMDGLTLSHPCTFEPAVFRGSPWVQSRVVADATGVTVEMNVNPQPVSAKGMTTGQEYVTTDSFSVSPHVGHPPASTAVTVRPRYSAGSDKDRFRLQLTLNVDVSSASRVNVTLGTLALTCG